MNVDESKLGSFFETFQKFLSFMQQNELSVKVNEGEESKSKLT